MTLLLDGKVAVITGAGSGMGLATARLFHAEGANVVLADVSGREQEVAEELGRRSIAIRADVAKSSEVAAMMDAAVSNYGGVDILCNIAGVGSGLERIADTPEDAFDRIFDVNTRGVFLTMKYAIPHMIARGGGAIVNVASTAAVKPIMRSLYSASKAAVVALTKVAAMEYGRDGIRANVVCPGAIETPMLLASVAGNTERVEMLKGRNPLGRLGSPDEIAHTMLFLSSSPSSYVTGEVVRVDGGFAI
jgi:NAD(P)-dependent dehydrogenase (short-subunit alcohol dehydrogenase family)